MLSTNVSHNSIALGYFHIPINVIWKLQMETKFLLRARLEMRSKQTQIPGPEQSANSTMVYFYTAKNDQSFKLWLTLMLGEEKWTSCSL